MDAKFCPPAKRLRAVEEPNAQQSKIVQPFLQAFCWTLSDAIKSCGAQVRKAFTADKARGNTLIVADYSQLELRLLAHIADCKSMQTAFKLGGDFHSRTALGMYDHIKEAIDEGRFSMIPQENG